MLVVRATTKLLGRLGVDAEAAPPPSTGVLGDWFATMLQVRHTRFVLAISAITLVPVIVLGRDLATFPARLADSVTAVLLHLGVPADAVERQRLTMEDVVFARTNDRSTVGVLTDFQRLLRFDLEDEPATELLQRSLRLARTPIVARHLFPDQATRSAFGLAPAKPGG